MSDVELGLSSLNRSSYILIQSAIYVGDVRVPDEKYRMSLFKKELLLWASEGNVRVRLQNTELAIYIVG